MIAQRLLEGEQSATISIIPYMLYKIRSSLTQANTDTNSSDQVKSISSLMLRKFEEEFGCGAEHTIATDHLTEGLWRRTKGIPKLALISMFLDPQTRSAVGIPTADQEIIWGYVSTELLDLAMESGPPPVAPRLESVLAPNV